MTSRGFTVLEGLVVVAIIGLLLAAAMPMVAEMVTNNRLRAVAEQVRDGLSLARMEAIRRNTTIKFIPNGTGWSVVQPGVGLNDPTTLAERPAYSAESAISAQASATEIAFNGSGRLTGAGPFTVQVTLTGAACVSAGGSVRCLNIEATRGGQIRMCDPAQPSSSPEGC